MIGVTNASCTIATGKAWRLMWGIAAAVIIVLWGFSLHAEEIVDANRPSTNGHQTMAPNRHTVEMKRLEVFDFREEGLLKKLARMENEINEKKRLISSIEKDIVSLKKDSGRLSAELANLIRQKAMVEQRLGERLVYLYKYARRGYMRALCTVKDLDEFRRRSKYLSLIMAEDRKLLEKAFIEKHEISKRLEKVKQDIIRTDALKRKEQITLMALKREVDRDVIQLMRIHEEKEFYQTAISELDSVDSGFAKTITNVEERNEDTLLQFKDIHGLKGRLPVPLLGTVIRGKRLFRSKRVHLSKGIFIRAKERTRVRAILPGRVEFSGRLKGYGQVIIINHGSRFFTISALLSHREKSEGDMVTQGEVIGEVGPVISGIGPSLYFEIRRGGRNLDPLKWLNIRG